MSTLKNRKKFPLGLILFVLTVAIYKAFSLKNSIGADWSSFGFLIGQDAFYMAALLVIGIISGLMTSRWLHAFVFFTLFLLAVMYLVDSLAIIALNDHAPLFDIARYSSEPGVVLSFFDASVYMAIVLLLGSLFVNPGNQGAVKRLSFIAFFVALITGSYSSANAPVSLARYSMLSPIEWLDNVKPGLPAVVYSDEQISFYATQADQKSFVPDSKPNIILLVIESLSSINSTRVSGVQGFLGGFDDLSEEGLLFQNFFANHQASEGGLIALLSGYPPIHFPTATPYMFDEFALQPAVIAEYKEQGYFIDFLTNAQLDFIGLNRFLSGIGVDRARGRDEVQTMKMAPVIVQDAPSDALLYDVAIQTIDQYPERQNPFLLCIATTSTHLPYRHPEGGADTAEAVWKWSLQQLKSFYRQLSDKGFFTNGILLVTGDHRQMRPLTEKELTRYGDSARARVPLLVIGQPYRAGDLDKRFFQQSDLLRMLGKTTFPDEPLSPYPIWVERYNRKYGRIELIDKLSVFNELDDGRREHTLHMPGNRIEWAGEAPDFAGTIEIRIHAQRSLHQQFRARRTQP